MAEGIRWSWETFPEHPTRSTGSPRGQLRRQPRPTPGIAHLGHGRRRPRRRLLTSSRKMARVLREALEAGAMGSDDPQQDPTRPPTAGRWPRGRRHGPRSSRPVSEMADAGAGIFQITGERAAYFPHRGPGGELLPAGWPRHWAPFTFWVRRRRQGRRRLTSSRPAWPRGPATSAWPTAGGPPRSRPSKTQLPFDALAAWKDSARCLSRSRPGGPGPGHAGPAARGGQARGLRERARRGESARRSTTTCS